MSTATPRGGRTERAALAVLLALGAFLRGCGSVDPPPCERNTDCLSCARTSNCGWCVHQGVGRCVYGFGAGPASATCGDNWSYFEVQCSEAPCSRATNCDACTRNAHCGFCVEGASGRCVPRAASADQPATGAFCSGAFQTSPTACAAARCPSAVDCAGCTPMAGCGFCFDAAGGGRCLAGSRAAGPVTGTCPGVVVDAPVACPSARCAELSDCARCVAATNCGWCAATGRCVAGNARDGAYFAANCPGPLTDRTGACR